MTHYFVWEYSTAVGFQDGLNEKAGEGWLLHSWKMSITRDGPVRIPVIIAVYTKETR